MCGIAGQLQIQFQTVHELEKNLQVMNELQDHRGPDSEGTWQHPAGFLGLSHKRLSIIDHDSGKQPMLQGQNVVTFNGEIYNYLELRKELGEKKFSTKSDTEVILMAYRKWGEDCVNHLRGMFAFAIWDESQQKLFCARDRFGIKPFYYTQNKNHFYFASEMKALLPFLNNIETDLNAFKDYLAFQFSLNGKTLFKDIQKLEPGYSLTIANGQVTKKKYWEVYYQRDFSHTAKYFKERMHELILESIKLHQRSDVPVGAYVSGGIDSTAIASIANSNTSDSMMAFSGRYDLGPKFDESKYAKLAADELGFDLHLTTITPKNFVDNIENVIYHLDTPIAGPGSFSQFMVSKEASKYRKVLLGGQGGDEIFGGYTRYLIAYFEQCIKAAIDGTSENGNFIVTYESIIPNLTALQAYKPMLKNFWQKGLFESMDKRYFRLINRSNSLTNEVNWDNLNDYSPFDSFSKIFHGDNVQKESYFDLMTNYDFKTLLPALLHVEDRVSMAHGIESRVPFLDHRIVELAATMPADIKFKNGNLKHILKKVLKPHLPKKILNRKDKMGFPTPLNQWAKNEVHDFIFDILSCQKAKNRSLIDNKKVLKQIDKDGNYGRQFWGFLSMEIWQQQFHDKAVNYKNMLSNYTPKATAKLVGKG
ncbi:MAG: asparagine synthase (glutamine-hydrolyzing) [Lentisphaeraceae bacterium]|nr:asparagine synthase (glutamine-hydrolyzing) [Lentisphaeraceae bacterium]